GRNLAAVLEKPDAHVPARGCRTSRRQTRHRTLRAPLRADTMARDGENTVRCFAQRLRAAAEDHILDRADRTLGKARGGSAPCRSRTHYGCRLRATPQDAAAKPQDVVAGCGKSGEASRP